MSLPIILSVHTPKCAGSSFYHAIQRIFTMDEIYYDYEESPFHPLHPVNTDPDYFRKWAQAGAFDFLENKRIVHGHLHINKYRTLMPAIRMTMLRDPVERLISHYHFWLYYPRKNHPTHDYFLDNALSIEDFARIDSLRYFYTGVFFKDVDMQSFNLIGAVEYWDEFIQRFKQLTSTTHLEFPIVNYNLRKDYNSVKGDILSDSKRLSGLRDILKDDMHFYDRWAGHGCY